MELKVKEVKKTEVDSVDEDKPDKFVTTMEAVGGEQIVKVSEIHETQFIKGDVYELKKLQSQTKLGDKK